MTPATDDSTLFSEGRHRFTGNGNPVCFFFFEPSGMRLFQRHGRFIFLMEGTGFIGPAHGKARLFPLQGEPGKPPERRSGDTRFPAEGDVDILEQAIRFFGQPRIVSIPLPHGPDGACIRGSQREYLPGDALPDARAGIIPVLPPAIQKNPDHPEQTRAVHRKVPPEGLQKILFFPAILNMRVAVIEAVLPMGVGDGELRLRQERPVLLVFFVQGRARNRHVEHELVEDRLVADRIIDDGIHIFRPVAFEADDR